MKRFGLVVAGFLVGGLIALQVPSAAQQPSDAAGTTDRTITVTGSATINAKPDEAVVSLGVHTQATKAQDAMDQNAAKMTQVIDALKAMGIGDADLATTNVSLNPMWSNDGNSIVGYQAENSIEVTVHDMGQVGKVIDAAVGAGANLAGGIVFRLSDQNHGVNDALAKAVENAKTKADAMATAAGATVGQVVTIAEASTPGPQPYYDRMGFAAAEAVSTPVNPPTIETEVQVTVTWQLV